MTARKYKCRILTSTPFEKEIYERFKELLPKGVCPADEYNEFTRQRVDELEREKNLNVIPRLKIFENIPLTNNAIIQKQSTASLDLLNMSSVELQVIIHAINDRKILAKIQRLSHVVESVTRTKIRRLSLEDV